MPQSEFDDSPDATGTQMIVDHDKVADKSERGVGKPTRHRADFLVAQLIGQRTLLAFMADFYQDGSMATLASAGQTQPGNISSRSFSNFQPKRP